MPRDSDDSPYKEARPAAGPPKRPPSRQAKHAPRRAAPEKPVHRPQVVAKSAAAGGAKRGRRRKKGGAPSPRNELTSHPTSRNAQVDTRAWLLKQYGPLCAYCGSKFTARVITLDHVAPRRGQTAYDRRDNLVLACRDCNAAKRDQAPLAFLLGRKGRAANLLKFGAHLSEGLIGLAKQLVGKAPTADETKAIREIWGQDDDDESPYKD